MTKDDKIETPASVETPQPELVDAGELSDAELVETIELDEAELPAEPIKRAGLDESLDGEPEGSGRSELDANDELAGTEPSS